MMEASTAGLSGTTVLIGKGALVIVSVMLFVSVYLLATYEQGDVLRDRRNIILKSGAVISTAPAECATTL